MRVLVVAAPLVAATGRSRSFRRAAVAAGVTVLPARRGAAAREVAAEIAAMPAPAELVPILKSLAG